MKADDIQFLNHNRPHYETLVKAGFVMNLTNEVRQKMLNIVRENFNPGYLCCLHCSADIAALLRYTYIQYDEYLSKNEIVNEIVELITEPKKRGRKPKL
jgi:hypothetical protein